MSGIFISYRRSDSAGHTGRLSDDLAKQLDGQALFRDIEAIEAGVDFVEALERAVSACSVMLVIIGPSWASVAADGQRRLFQTGDFVRMEIEAALARNIRVIPVLVGEAQMPGAADLPDSMAALLRRNAYSISDRRWQYDVGQLVDILVKIPGVAARKGDPKAVITPAAKNGISGWVKATFIGVGLFFAGVAGLWLIPDPKPVATKVDAPLVMAVPASAGPPAAALTSAPDAPAPAESPFYGDWVASNGESYNINTEESGSLYVAAGSKLDDGTGFGPNSATPTKAGEQLWGNGNINGRRLKAALIDAVSNQSFVLQLDLSEDGQSLTGVISSGEKSARQLVLARR